MDDQRFEIRTGALGQYFHDTTTGKDLSISEVLPLLNAPYSGVDGALIEADAWTRGLLDSVGSMLDEVLRLRVSLRELADRGCLSPEMIENARRAVSEPSVLSTSKEAQVWMVDGVRETPEGVIRELWRRIEKGTSLISQINGHASKGARAAIADDAISALEGRQETAWKAHVAKTRR